MSSLSLLQGEAKSGHIDPTAIKRCRMANQYCQHTFVLYKKPIKVAGKRVSEAALPLMTKADKEKLRCESSARANQACVCVYEY